MVRKLKHHEQKLLRKVDFTTYTADNDHRDASIIRRYNIQKPGDYGKYNRIAGVSLSISKISSISADIDSQTPSGTSIFLRN
jgi:hypothetical protein